MVSAVTHLFIFFFLFNSFCARLSLQAVSLLTKPFPIQTKVSAVSSDKADSKKRRGRPSVMQVPEEGTVMCAYIWYQTISVPETAV